ncbi:hypothetical protein WR25_17098 isoform B [Diploscapter pachys]|uniref:RNA helicase n=4 Tax=Diploscapter pachys TaxID=2018661 RepID=A0A2A2JAF6_9BILA|nr:hypothetical protein WR25_17098 isoform B [Diploscapter pachys]
MSDDQFLPLGDPRFPAFLRLYRFELMDWILPHLEKDFMHTLHPIINKTNSRCVEFVLAVQKNVVSAIDKFYGDMDVPPIDTSLLLNLEPTRVEEMQTKRQEKVAKLKADLAGKLESYVEHAVMVALFYNEDGVRAIDELLKEYNNQLWEIVHMKNYTVESFPFRNLLFEKLFPPTEEGRDPHDQQLLDRFCAALQCTQLEKNAARYTENDVKPIKDRFNNFDFSLPLRWQACNLVRHLFFLRLTSTEVFWGLVELLNADPHNRAALCIMFPESNWQEELAKLRDEHALQREKELSRHNNATREVAALVDPKEMRSQYDYMHARSAATTRATEDNIIDVQALQLRPYQEELVKDAIIGHNTLIVAPTGSGKTPVAVYIAIKHLEDREQSGKRGRVIMLVPRVPLVKQQKDRFNQFMSTKYYVEGFHGAEAARNSSRRDTILASDVIVITPQIFVNMLRSVRECERLFIADFSLLIFDEAHHAVKDHAYAVIMRLIKKYDGPRPQIVGLTASPRVTADSREVMYNEVVQLLARLECTKISTVHRTILDLEKFVSKPDDEIKEVNKPGEQTVEYHFISLVATTVMNIHERLNSHYLESLAKGVSTSGHKLEGNWLKFPGVLSKTVTYYIFLTGLEEQLRNIGRNSAKFIPLLTVLYLKALVNVIEMAEVLPMTYAYSHLEAEIKDIERTSPVDFCVEFVKNLRGGIELMLEENRPAICKELLDEIKSQFVKNVDSRVIVFVEERGMAVKLADFIDKNTSDEIAAAYVLGTNKSYRKGTRGGYTQTNAEQQANIAGFREGKFKVMVATSVIEEGLDVKDCNLIIKYNCSGSTVQNMQRRGRARAQGSRSILLVLDSRKSDQEYRALQNEKLLRHVLEMIRENGEKNLEDRVKREQENQLQEMERLEKEEEEKRINLSNNLFDVMCSICNHVKFVSASLRFVGTNAVCVEPNVWNNISLDVSESIKYKRIIKSNCSLDTFGAVKCGFFVRDSNSRCLHILGKIYRFGGVYLPQFDVKQLQFQSVGNRDEPLKSFASWNEVTQHAFCIPEANDSDLADMLNSLAENKQEDKAKLDILGERIQRQIDSAVEHGFRGNDEFISGDEDENQKPDSTQREGRVKQFI